MLEMQVTFYGDDGGNADEPLVTLLSCNDILLINNNENTDCIHSQTHSITMQFLIRLIA